MSRGKKYIIKENDMKVILNVIHWNCFICKTECDQNGKGEKWEELEKKNWKQKIFFECNLLDWPIRLSHWTAL